MADDDPAGFPTTRLDTHDARVVGISFEPAEAVCVQSSDFDVVEHVETARKRDDRTPGSVLVCRDADTPLVGNCDMPCGDDAVVSAGGEHDVPESVSILESARRLPPCAGSEDSGPDQSRRVGAVDPRHDGRAAGADDDMRGPDRRSLPVERDNPPATVGMRRYP